MTPKKTIVGAKPYEGDLAKPLPAIRVRGIRGRGEVSPAEYARLILDRMFLLCDHYGLRRGAWFLLALCLARKHVPGLKPSKARSGRPESWTPSRKMVLAAAFEGLGDAYEQEPEKLPELATRAGRREWLARQPEFAEDPGPNLKGRSTVKQRAEALRKQLPKPSKQTARKAPKPPPPRKAGTRFK